MMTIEETFDELNRLTAALHANRCHPDYVYSVIPSWPLPCGVMESGGWERNPEYQCVPGDECWRRRKETT